ncbi:DUF488 domain-containing protein [Bacillus sp. FJAT-27225]|uniref:DUF488 domain-containing protein n=1 Tax=Bacillus sp. FJAT-27225 TaxID=1743144 RepID=UPI000981DCC4|nr:DUF488 domain-containing protein [Bacillus sp. FJAT-27225]
MEKFPIYTIGYGNRTIKTFIDELVKYEIDFLIDVRTNPKSSYDASFIRNNLSEVLQDYKIRYVFMGDLLGGLPPEDECYTNGKVDYKKVATQPFYLKGIKRLTTAYEKNLRVALMCSELKPESCHRSKLIGETLTANNINVKHIDEIGRLLSQEKVIERLTGGQLALFDEVYTSRKQYK